MFVHFSAVYFVLQPGSEKVKMSSGRYGLKYFESSETLDNIVGAANAIEHAH